MGGNDETASIVPVLLLKTTSSPSDAYEEYFGGLAHQNHDFRPQFVPVLQHQFLGNTLGWLKAVISNGGLRCATSTGHDEQERFGGFIFTSQRAVDAFAETINILRASGMTVEDLISQDLPMFVVGPATARGVRAIQMGNPVLGEETGNGEALAEYILNHHESSEARRGRRKPLLFLVGEQRRDTIPKTLQSETLPEDRRIEVVEKIVYGTAERDTFANDFTGSLLQFEGAAKAIWVVVFSPTGCQAMLQSLGWLNSDGKFDAGLAARQNSGVRVATIGPTTRDFLSRTFTFEPHVCAETPTPDGVGSGIMKYMVDS